MKLTRTEPHPHYTNLKNETYKCETCGRTETIAVRVA